MNRPAQRTKVAVLGGGVGGMTAAFELTATPELQQQFDVTLYQLGWRNGGKGASGRNGDVAERIELVGEELVICMKAHTKGAESNLDIGWVPIFHVAQMRDGKVVRVRAFLDEEQAMAAAGAGSPEG